MQDATKYDGLDIMFFQGGSPHAFREGDTVHLPAPDDYDSLAEKVAAFFAYCLDHHGFEHLFKCDDDTYVHLPRLMQMDLSRIDYAGSDDWKRGAASGGGGYWVSRRAASIVVDQVSRGGAAAETKRGYPEDVLVGEVLRSAGIRIHHVDTLPGREFDRFNPKTAPLPRNDRITGHYSSPEEMYAIRAQWEPGREPASQHFAIERARWGAGGDWVDVTAHVSRNARAMVFALLEVDPSRFGDPAVGRRKTLVVDMNCEGVPLRLTVGESFSYVMFSRTTPRPGEASGPARR